jgi:hypothetical protein
MTARPVLRAGKGMVRPLGASEVFAEGAHRVRVGSNQTYGCEAQTRVLTGLDRAARSALLIPPQAYSFVSLVTWPIPIQACLATMADSSHPLSGQGGPLAVRCHRRTSLQHTQHEGPNARRISTSAAAGQADFRWRRLKSSILLNG